VNDEQRIPADLAEALSNVAQLLAQP